jgi:hypothetical protein
VTRVIILGIMLWLGFSATVKAQTDAAMDASRSIAFFTCFVFASEMKDQKKTELHFNQGVASIRTFLKAAEDRKISKEDWSAKVPVVISLNLSGPSSEFIAGRVFQNVLDMTYKETFCKKGWPNCETDKELIKSLAQTSYSKQNCDLLLK